MSVMKICNNLQSENPFTYPTLGSPYTNTYDYDSQYRLVKSNGSGQFGYAFNANYSPAGRMGTKATMTSAWQSDQLFGYDYAHLTHQPRTILESNSGIENLFWDRNGNLAQVVRCEDKLARLHEWDEENRLHSVLGEQYAGFYGYDANGERIYKLTGKCSIEISDLTATAQPLLDNAVIYPNPYLLVTKQGYIKHYYAGNERIATVMGGGGFDSIIQPIASRSLQFVERVDTWYSHYHTHDPFRYAYTVSGTIQTVDFIDQQLGEIAYKCNPLNLENVIVPSSPRNILLPTIDYFSQIRNPETQVYYYHPDHLGSASWITNTDGDPIQYIHYAPYGELIANQTPLGYNERFKFSGKERDVETGYDFFGARYYSSIFGHFTSPDPLADKYLYISPYTYCNWNPVKYVDPDGMGPKDRVILAREFVNQNIPYDQQYNYSPSFLRTATTPEALAYMDCSEFVCRVMAGDGITSTIESHSTKDLLANMMSDETKFIKSDMPQAGDIVLWNGHTGIVESYNEKDGNVTVLHATQYGGTKDEKGKVVYKVSSTCRENYSLKYYRGKNAFFYRPVNETPDVFEEASTAKLPEITVKPSKDDQNANY